LQEGQQLVTGGAYGLVRHPAYLGAMLVWLGLAVALLSPIVLTVTVVYVAPMYLLYITSEEKMMRDEFGAAYARYCRDVPMLLPYSRLIPALRPREP
jgi:protein-S-isoprenylcysteine O-methyltransferase Ste14